MFLYVNFPKWIRPTVFSFLPIRWYALMYLVAFAIAYALFRRQQKADGVLKEMSGEDVISLFMYLIICLIIGGRLFSTLFYEGSSYYWTHPHLIFWPFREGRFVGLPGMSYHGGVAGVVVGCSLYCRKYKKRFWEVSDVIVVSVPLGYTFGRLGNFINAELWGRCTGSAYGMVFPYAERFSTAEEWVRTACEKAGISYNMGDLVNLPRHPSQLYEAFFEGIVLFLIIWFAVRPYARSKKSPFGYGFLTGFYLFGYGFVRFIIEYFREPDEQLGFVIALGREKEPTALFKSVFNLSLGQILCFLMIAAGLLIMAYAKKTGNTRGSAGNNRAHDSKPQQNVQNSQNTQDAQKLPKKRPQVKSVKKKK